MKRRTINSEDAARRTPGFIPVCQYGNDQPILPGEIGRIDNVLFIIEERNPMYARVIRHSKYRTNAFEFLKTADSALSNAISVIRSNMKRKGFNPVFGGRPMISDHLMNALSRNINTLMREVGNVATGRAVILPVAQAPDLVKKLTRKHGREMGRFSAHSADADVYVFGNKIKASRKARKK